MRTPEEIISDQLSTLYELSGINVTMITDAIMRDLNENNFIIVDISNHPLIKEKKSEVLELMSEPGKAIELKKGCNHEFENEPMHGEAICKNCGINEEDLYAG